LWLQLGLDRDDEVDITVFVEVAYSKRALQICANELRGKDRPHPGDELPEDVIELREGRRKHVGRAL